MYAEWNPRPDAPGETRNVPRPRLAEFRARGRSRKLFPRLERARNLTAIYAHMLERQERE